MHGLMQSWPLTVDRILTHASRYHGDSEVVSRRAGGEITRTNYETVRVHANQLSHALQEAGIVVGDRVATLAWNSDRHLEAWYGITGIGAVLHTLNPRFHASQLAWIIRHAEDKIVLCDADLLPKLLEALEVGGLTVESIVVFDAGERTESEYSAGKLLRYEGWIRDRPSTSDTGSPAWGRFSEETACGLCYTSGTTGDPKGALYSHRSNFLHALTTLQSDVMGLSSRDVVLPLVPMFHANAWGLVFSAPAVGAKLVMPGPRLDGESIHELLEQERVTFAAAVPTVWQTLLQYLDNTGGRLSTLRRVLIGGSACPPSLIQRFSEEFGIEARHAWGMTELSPVGTVNAATRAIEDAAQLSRRAKQGRPPIGVELKLEDEHGRPVEENGMAHGRLLAKGPAVIERYFRATGSALDGDGYFDTGDIATIDELGCMQITDRAKDVIKSGGEWISSTTIETMMYGHSKIAFTAVIGVPDAKWGERPVLVVQLKCGHMADQGELLEYLCGKVTNWWIPTKVVFMDSLPLGPTGKIDKRALRAIVLSDTD
jgi:fatty-acyl-CoA synthase